MLQPPPLKPRSPLKAARRVTVDPPLPRSFSHPGFSRLPPSEALLDRLQRHRPMRNALLFLISLVLAANCVWAVQGLAAWRRGGSEGRSAGDERLLFQRLNSTTLSVEVSRVGGDKDGEAAGRSTFLLNAQLVDKANSTQQAQQAQQAGASRLEQTERAAAAAVDAAVSRAEAQPEDIVGRLREMGTALTGALAAGVESWMGGASDGVSEDAGLRGHHLGRHGKAGAAAGGDAGKHAAAATAGDTTPAGEKAPAPPSPTPHRATLKMPEVDERSKDECAQALHLPRVALLFLTMGDLYHHETWARWFQAVRDQLPVHQLRAAACPAAPAPAAEPAAAASQRQLGGSSDNKPAEDRSQREQQEGELPQGPAAVAAACGWNASAGRPLLVGGNASGGGSSPIDQQHLFSVYVHAPPNIKDEDLPPFFRGRLIADRLQPQWGTHQLVEATRNLLWEAFRDPLNERFVLLSESDIPLYDPLTLHQQLMADTKSRMNLCRRAAPTDTRRWSWRMAMSLSSPHLKAWHWRKSSQWFGLLRRHVEVVLQDVEVFRRFEEHCWNGWDGDYKRWRDCYSDEHYIPTLLASKGLDAESSCYIDGIVAADWSAGGAHPKAYRSWEVRRGLIHKARGEDRGCNATAAISGGQRMFVPKHVAFGQPAGVASSGEAAWQRGVCGTMLAPPLPAFDQPLALNCSLTSRKFPKPTVRAVGRLFTDCHSGLQLLTPAACPQQP
ncbi:hypothetical protein ABPG75_010033 [Micractinium tetrahymenae]